MTINRRQIRRGLHGMVVVGMFLGGSGVATAVPPIQDFREDGIDPIGLPDIDLPEFYAPGPVRFIERGSTHLTVRWQDRSAIEDGSRLERRLLDGTWTTVASFGPITGAQEHTEEDLDPDRAYCYRVRTFNDGIELGTPMACGRTRDGRGHSAWRAELILQVGDVEDAGSDDSFMVRLNAGAGETPSGNHTYLDYGRDDFERGTAYSYDLKLSSISDISDITQIEISKDGSDGVCLDGFILKVNGREIYREAFVGNCLWLDNEGGAQRSYTVPTNRLRNHAAWIGYRQPAPPLFIGTEELRSRIEGLTGHKLHGKDAYWGHLDGDHYVDLEFVNESTIHVNLDLSADVAVLNDPEVEIDFDLLFVVACDAATGEVKLDITGINQRTDVDADILTDILTVGQLDDYVEGIVNDTFEPIEEALSFRAGDACDGQMPTVTIVDAANGPFVLFGLVDVEEEPGGMVVGTLSDMVLAHLSDDVPVLPGRMAIADLIPILADGAIGAPADAEWTAPTDAQAASESNGAAQDMDSAGEPVDHAEPPSDGGEVSADEGEVLPADAEGSADDGPATHDAHPDEEPASDVEVRVSAQPVACGAGMSLFLLAGLLGVGCCGAERPDGQ